MSNRPKVDLNCFAFGSLIIANKDRKTGGTRKLDLECMQNRRKLTAIVGLWPLSNY